MSDDSREHTPLKSLRDQVKHYTQLARAHRDDVERSMAKASAAEAKAEEFQRAVVIMEAAT